MQGDVENDEQIFNSVNSPRGALPFAGPDLVTGSYLTLYVLGSQLD